jgi:predicted nuclease with TOPRIM domain
MGIKQDSINNLKTAVDIIHEMQNTIYGYSTKQNISASDLKKAGAEKLSNDLYSFVAKTKAIIKKLEPLFFEVAENNVLFKKLQTENDKLQEYSDIYTKMEHGFQAWKQDITGGTATPLYGESSSINIDNVIEKLNTQVTRLEKQNIADEIVPKLIDEAVSKTQQKWSELFKTNKTSAPDQEAFQKEIREEVKKTLPVILKSVVTEVTNEKKFTTTWANVIKGSQVDMKEAVDKTFKATLESALKENQGEIVEKTIMKQEADQYEKDRRSRNIVITKLPESTKSEIPQKVADDKQFIVSDLNIPECKIIKCYRAGPPLGQGSNETRTEPRPLIVVLESPTLAKEYHKYGNGSRILVNEKELWINQDFTRTERNANYEARKARKFRSGPSNLGLPSDNAKSKAISE